VRKVAKDYPNVAYLMGDTFRPGRQEPLRVRQLHPRALLPHGHDRRNHDQDNKIGMVGGYPIGEVNRLFNAFMAGAKATNPAVQFKVSFIGSWYDPPKAKEFAYAQVEAGVDVLYAERSGVVDSAREKGIIAFGNVNDMNKSENGENVVVTSALWHMESALNHAIERVKARHLRRRGLPRVDHDGQGRRIPGPVLRVRRQDPGRREAKVAETEAAIKAGKLVIEINDNEPKSTF
jgi:nucleoside-binding protein